jgi:hypothetical protein
VGVFVECGLHFRGEVSRIILIFVEMAHHLKMTERTLHILDADWVRG